MKFREDSTTEQREAALAAVAGLPSKVPAISSMEIGFDMGLRSDNYDLAVVVAFVDQAAYQEYASDPLHVAVIKEHLAPFLEGRAGVQFEV